MLAPKTRPRIGMGCFVVCFFSTWGIGYWAVVVEDRKGEPGVFVATVVISTMKTIN